MNGLYFALDLSDLYFGEVMKLFVFLLLAFSVVQAQEITAKVGDKAQIRTDDVIPASPYGTLWKITGKIANMNMAIGGMSGSTAGILQVELVKLTSKEAGDKLNKAEIGGYLQGPWTPTNQNVLREKDGKHYVEFQIEYAVTVSTEHTVGKSTRIISGTEKLPQLPAGYEWKFQSKVDNSTTIVPGYGRSLDKEIYVLSKTRADLPDTITLHKIVMQFATSEEEAEQIVNKKSGCGGTMGGFLG